jgi:uncharacterized protein YggE
MKQTRLFVSLLFVLVASQAALAQRTITVMGDGRAAVKPDYAMITMTVTAQDPTVQGAFAKSEAAEASITKALTGAGGSDFTMRTFALNPTYDYSQPTSSPKVVGYTMISYYEAKVRDLKALPKVLDAASGAGATNLGIDSYGSSKSSKLKDDAVKQAIANAREKAEKLAKEMGGTLGEILSIADKESSGGGGGGGGSYEEREAEERRGMIGRINPSEIARSTEVKVTFSVR